MLSQNPLARIRKAAGLTQQALSTLTNCSIQLIQMVENGNLQTSPKVFNALAELGYGSPETLQREYAAWRTEKARETRMKLPERMIFIDDIPAGRLNEQAIKQMTGSEEGGCSR